MKLTGEQKEAIDTGITQDILIRAVAGAGKSSTLNAFAKHLISNGTEIDKIKILVFNTENAQSLIKKFGIQWSRSISTINSLGNQILKNHLGRSKVDPYKYMRLANELAVFNFDLKDKKAPISKKASFHTLINLVRANNLTTLDTSVLQDIQRDSLIEGIRDWDYVCEKLKLVINQGNMLAEEAQIIDYLDQIWLPVRWNLAKEVTGLKYICLDEAQDTNKLQQQFIVDLKDKETIFVGVADPRQAIYGFAGADTNSFDTLITAHNAKEVGLSLCFRCPKSHIKLVNRLYPDIDIKAREDAPIGTMSFIGSEQLTKETLQEGDLIICRSKGPLVSLCINLIARGVDATIIGENIVKELAEIIHGVCEMPGFKFEEFLEFLAEYHKFKLGLYKSEVNEEELSERLEDKIEAVKALYSNKPFSDINEFNQYIHQVLDRNQATVNLCSCHKAKGLEADRVFILEPDRLPHIRTNQSQEQFQQELNLHYVALTRSKRDLFFIGSATWIDLSVLDSFDTDNSQELPELQTDLKKPKLDEPGLDTSNYQKVAKSASNLSLTEKSRLIAQLRQEITNEQLELTISDYQTIENGNGVNS